MNVAGVDGAPGGWMVAIGAIDPHASPTIEFRTTLDELFAELGRTISHAIVDMPIGLSTDGRRPADDEARSRLGKRRSSFFPTPVRSVLSQTSFDDANAASRAASGKGLSMQSWNLVPKIRELDALVTAETMHCVLEGHPESSFAELSGAPLETRKTTPEGRAERLALLDATVAPNVEQLISTTSKRIDVIDALILLWTARRVQAGSSIRLGGVEDRDALGRPMWLTI